MEFKTFDELKHYNHRIGGLHSPAYEKHNSQRYCDYQLPVTPKHSDSLASSWDSNCSNSFFHRHYSPHQHSQRIIQNPVIQITDHLSDTHISSIFDPIVDVRSRKSKSPAPISPPLNDNSLYANTATSSSIANHNNGHSGSPIFPLVIDTDSPTVINRLSPVLTLPPPVIPVPASGKEHQHQSVSYFDGTSSLSDKENKTCSTSSSSKTSKKQKTQAEALARYDGMKLSDFKGRIFRMSKDQYGCRYLQSLVEKDSSCIDIILDEVDGQISQMMTDPFGNYLCQKLFECSSDNQLRKLIKKLSPQMSRVSQSMHGTRAVQKLIERIQKPDHMKLFEKAITKDVVSLTKDLNGNHVVQKCLMRFGTEQKQFIYDAIGKSCVEVATHKHGCCVFQRCFDHAFYEYQKTQLVNVVIENILDLIEDQYGNYVVQYVLELKVPKYSELVVQSVLGNVHRLSVQKFSSNVVEKCIMADTKFRFHLISEILIPFVLEKLIADPYGNYVIQRAVQYACPTHKYSLIDQLKPYLSTPNEIHNWKVNAAISRLLTGHGYMFIQAFINSYIIFGTNSN